MIFEQHEHKVKRDTNLDYEEVLGLLPDEALNSRRCFAFSLHKCGSTMMNAMIDTVCRANKIPCVSLPNYFFNQGIRPVDWARDERLVPAFSKNVVYMDFRFLPPIFQSEDFAVNTQPYVLLVRDPRDALVSQYFSFGRSGGSHVAPEKGAARMRAQMRENDQLTIDEYVLKEAPALNRKLMRYKRTLDFKTGLLRRYEDVYFDKATFVQEIFEQFEIEVSKDSIRSAAQRHDIRPAKEDPTKHIRKGTPGDHVEKLQPATIEQLNSVFASVSSSFGYLF